MLKCMNESFSLNVHLCFDPFLNIKQQSSYLRTLQLFSDIIQGVPALVRPQALVESNASGAYAHICSLKGIIKVLNVSLEKHHHTTNYDHCQRQHTDFTTSCWGLQP